MFTYISIDMPNIWDDQLENQNNIRYVSGTKIVSYNLILLMFVDCFIFRYQQLRSTS